jgi:hypothetical protein
MSEAWPADWQGYEVVHTMTDYYDGPRGGIADYHGKPHLYQSLDQETPDGLNVFLLQPVDEDTFRLAKEDWAIWCRWEHAYHNRRATEDTHPALPEERNRHEELKALLEPRLTVDEKRTFKMKGRFEVGRPGEPGLTLSGELIVWWMPLEANAKT